MARWTCQRVSGGVKCGFTNEATKKLCFNCNKPRAKKRKPPHMRALDIPYSEYIRLNGGIERCAICGKEPSPMRSLDRDHDHKTGLPRGLLCWSCNTRLKNACTVDWLLNAADYLESAPERRRLSGVGRDLEVLAAAARTPARAFDEDQHPEDDSYNERGGLFAAQPERKPTSDEERALRDRERYHPANPRDYASTIGMPYEDAATGETLYACVGCYWCEPGEVWSATARTPAPKEGT